MRRFALSFVVTIAAWAQQAAPDPAALVNGLDKQMAPLADAWLKSGDPRTQAWGAYLVLRDQRTDALPALLEIVANYTVADGTFAQPDANRHDAMLEVLDALIQLGARVPVADAQRIYPEFPVQSLIFLGRANMDDASPAL